MEILLEILKGAFLGFMTVLVGWSKKQTPGKFNWKGLLLRVPTGVVVGAIAGYNGWDLAQAQNFAASIGVILLVDNLTKMVVRRLNLFEKKDDKVDKAEDKV